MAAFLDLLSSAPRPILWLESTAYAGRLLANGAIPWLDTGGFVAWQRKAQGLLKSDVTTLPVTEVCAAWIAAHPDLATAMAAKRRAVFPLKTLLGDESLREHLVDLAKGLRASFAQTPLALVLPSPRRWVALAYAQAWTDANVDVGEDEADSASVYIADFLRAFGDCRIDSLLLEESSSSGLVDTSSYQTVFNLAAHYRWDVGLRVVSSAGETTTAPGVSYLIAPRVLGAVRTGLALAPEFWSGAPAPPNPHGGFRYVEVPAGAQPETVLDRLATLR
jgi:hypothetical protein